MQDTRQGKALQDKAQTNSKAGKEGGKVEEQREQ